MNPAHQPDQEGSLTLVSTGSIQLPCRNVLGILDRRGTDDPLAVPHRAGARDVARLGEKPQWLHLLGTENRMVSNRAWGQKTWREASFRWNSITWPESPSPLRSAFAISHTAHTPRCLSLLFQTCQGQGNSIESRVQLESLESLTLKFSED